MKSYKPWNEEIERLDSLVCPFSKYCKRNKLKKGVDWSVVECKLIRHSQTCLPYNLRSNFQAVFNSHLL